MKTNQSIFCMASMSVKRRTCNNLKCDVCVLLSSFIVSPVLLKPVCFKPCMFADEWHVCVSNTFSCVGAGWRAVFSNLYQFKPTTLCHDRYLKGKELVASFTAGPLGVLVANGRLVSVVDGAWHSARHAAE